MAEQLTLDGTVQKAKRRSYTREEKLKVIGFYHSNGKNLYQTCKKFSLNTKTVLRWIHAEEAIRDSGKGRRRIDFKRTAMHPDMAETHTFL